VITLVRVDNRLIHGQVVEAWLPHLKVARVVVADDEAANSVLIRAAMGLAVQSSVEVQIETLNAVNYGALSLDAKKTLLIVREVSGLLDARKRGLTLPHVNLGNVHFATGRRQVSPSVFLSPDELNQLKILAEQGVEVEARGVPMDRAIGLDELSERFEKGT
jgi:mannose/fructose/N-acetylgalactosamine-specific phosphotransferase system component IIB